METSRTTREGLSLRTLMKKRLSFLIFLFAFTPLATAQESKSRFWQTQRKGANWFNRKPTKEWLLAAQKAKLEFVRLAPSKWPAAQKDFLIGDADRYRGIPAQDLAALKTVLDQAQSLGIKIVLTPLSLPGARWRQQNGNKEDLRLWKDSRYWAQATAFWQDLARHLKDHPAIVAYNILNEPHPELADGYRDGHEFDFAQWYSTVRNTPADLNQFNATLIAAIRAVDQTTPIVLDCGLWAAPTTMAYLTPVKDNNVLYSVHMYEPYEFTSAKPINHEASYPGQVYQTKNNQPVAITLNQVALQSLLAPIADWQKRYQIRSDQILVGEFGIRRRVKGAANYLEDLIKIFNQQRWHWAFYAFREDEWDAMDYELGTGPVPAGYWQANERGIPPVLKRTDNPLWAVIKKEFIR